MTARAARSPGRVNLIGDHTDYTGGLCFPMAIDLAIEVRGGVDDTGGVVHLSTAGEPDAIVPLDVADPSSLTPSWARYVAGVVAELRPTTGFTGTVTSTLPAGAGLSSSAALEIAVALALGAEGSDVVALARLCQAAEHRARGVPTGLLDQLACLGGVEGHGLLLDCRALSITPVPLPPADEVEWVVVHTGPRSIADSAYATRVAELAEAAEMIGPIRDADLGAVAPLPDGPLRMRARHVITENQRVRDFAAAIGAGDAAGAGALMLDSHRSLSVDFESSTRQVDDLVARLIATPGVLGARITGAGWGGCVVALTRPGAVDLTTFERAWTVRPAAGATVVP